VTFGAPSPPPQASRSILGARVIANGDATFPVAHGQDKTRRPDWINESVSRDSRRHRRAHSGGVERAIIASAMRRLGTPTIGAIAYSRWSRSRE